MVDTPDATAQRSRLAEDSLKLAAQHNSREPAALTGSCRSSFKRRLSGRAWRAGSGRSLARIVVSHQLQLAPFSAVE